MPCQAPPGSLQPRYRLCLQARGFVGSNPTAPTFFEYLIRRVVAKSQGIGDILHKWGKSGATSGCRERRRHVPVLLGMEALARHPRPWSATGCIAETTRIASHRRPARGPTGSTGFLATD